MEQSEGKDNVIEFPIASSEFETAAMWIARVDKGLDGDARMQLEAWLRERPEHSRALFELAAFWDDLDVLAKLAPLAHLDQRAAPRAQAPARWAAAAVVVAAVVGLILWFGAVQPRQGETPVTVADYSAIFSTPVGELATEMLPDGSVIKLNTDTELNVRYSEHDRIVELHHGEAHFAVAHDPGRPFGVRVGGHIVQAVGTAFNIRLQDAGSVEVTVTDGIVQILEEKESADAAADEEPRWWGSPVLRTGLVQGQATTLGDATVRGPEVLRLEPVDLEIKLAWQSGVLIFEGEALRTVIDEFQRYTTTTFSFDGAEAAERRVGGIFQIGATDDLLLSLQENFNIASEQLADGTIQLRAAAQ